MEGKTIAYRRKVSSLVFATVFFAVCALAIVHRAQINRQGLIINGIVRLAPDGATKFYWAAAAASALLMAIGLISLSARLVGGPRHLKLTGQSIIVPQGLLGRRDVVVPYAAIRNMRLVTVSRQVFLEFRHAGGRVTILRSVMPSTEVFDELVRFLSTRVRRV